MACLFLFSCAFSRASSVVTSGPFYFNCNFHCRLQLEAFLVGRFLQDHHHRFQHCFTFCRSFTSLVIIITLHYTLSALYQIYCCYCIFRCFLFTLCSLHFWCSADFTFHEIVCVVQQHLNQSEFSLSFSLEEHITFALHLRNCFVFRLCPFSTLGLSLSTDFSRLCTQHDQVLNWHRKCTTICTEVFYVIQTHLFIGCSLNRFSCCCCC